MGGAPHARLNRERSWNCTHAAVMPNERAASAADGRLVKNWE
jgi:hypothetical protein